MTKVLTVINIILAAILAYILVYPQIQANKIIEAQALYVKDLSALPLFVAEDMGFFDSTRVRCQLEEVEKPGSDVDEVMKTASQMSFGLDWGTFLFKAAVRPEAYRVVMSTSSTISEPYTALFVRKRSRIRKFKQFAGKKIGYPRDTRALEFLKMLLKKDGVDVEKCNFIAIADFEMDSALVKKLVDVLLAFEPYRSLLMKDPNVRLFADAYFERNLFTPFPLGLAYTTITNISVHKKAVQRLVKATDMAVEWIRKNPDKAIEIARKRFELPDSLIFNLPTYQKHEELDFVQFNRFVTKAKEAEIILFEIDANKFLLRPEEIK